MARKQTILTVVNLIYIILASVGMIFAIRMQSLVLGALALCLGFYAGWVSKYNATYLNLMNFTENMTSKILEKMGDSTDQDSTDEESKDD